MPRFLCSQTWSISKTFRIPVERVQERGHVRHAQRAIDDSVSQMLALQKQRVERLLEDALVRRHQQRLAQVERLSEKVQNPHRTVAVSPEAAGSG